MKPTLGLLTVAVCLGLAACGQKGPESAPPAPTLAPPSLDASADTQISGDAAAAPSLAELMIVEIPSEVPTDTDTTSNEAYAPVLAALNRALQFYQDPSSRPGGDDLRIEHKIYPPIKDPSDLVKAGFLRSLPTPPPGKQFAIDRDNNEVVLVNKH